ncbi:MAG: hypothetical protein IKL98_08715 [Akkermansia sp.]|nr:hypothetical protein [Akkermansia sp.]MBR3943629.1 hypothetical protein [Akkermansia sp.]
MKNLLPILTTIVAVLCPASAQTLTLEQAYAPYKVNATEAIIGKEIKAVAGIAPEQLFENIRQTWLEDIRENRQDGDLETLSDEEIQPALAALEEYIAAAHVAYQAQMEFALYSLEPVKNTHPQRYQTALQQYKHALLALYRQDARILRSNSVLTPYYRHPEIVPPKEDAFCDALITRAEQSDLGGAGYRAFRAQGSELLKQQLKLKQDTIISHLCPGGDFSLGREFISNTDINTAGFDAEEYRRVRTEKFKAAEAAWEQYSWAAARLHCPLPQFSGTGTGSMISAQQEYLALNHEKLLILLMRGIRE